MLILSIKTDKPEAEIGLFDSELKLDYLSWPAGRELAETIHVQIGKLLKKNGKHWSDIEAVACFKGPGSFTGLRIGLSVANAIAYSLELPIVATNGHEWIKLAAVKLAEGQTDNLGIPEYGSAVHITPQKK